MENPSALLNTNEVQCSIVAGYACGSHKYKQTVRVDTTDQKTFTPRKCWKDGIKLLKEVKKTPHCETVTKAAVRLQVDH